MITKPTKFVLLTGAGFSKNFGGWIGNELWQQIRSHLPEKLRKIFPDNEDYETAYTNAMESADFTKGQKQTIQNAVIQSYADLCNNMTKIQARKNEIFSRFIKPFLNFKGTERPFFFTLNQDLFLEYKHQWFSPKGPRLETDITAIKAGKKNFKDLKFEQITNTISPVVNFAEIEGDIYDHAGPAYIKLHGSYGWYSSDGKHRLVIGSPKMKMKKIKEEPLFDWYFKIFEEVMRSQKNILVIGYSFRDKHINDVIKKSHTEYDSRICVINPSLPHTLPFTPTHYPSTLADILQDNEKWRKEIQGWLQM
jgi:hypothetical protein